MRQIGRIVDSDLIYDIKVLILLQNFKVPRSSEKIDWNLVFYPTTNGISSRQPPPSQYFQHKTRIYHEIKTFYSQFIKNLGIENGANLLLHISALNTKTIRVTPTYDYNKPLQT